jgi:hypothetical protein
MKLAALVAFLLVKSIPGWDGRYATHDAGSLNRENRRGLTQ